MLTLAALLSAVVFSQAQTSQGRVLLGGSASLNLPTNDNPERSTFRMTPRVGAFLIDDFAIGASVPVTISKVGDNRSSSVGFAPFGRFYVGPPNVKLFLEGRFGIEHYSSRNVTNGRETKTSDDAIFVGFGIGGAFFLNDNVAIEPQFSYDAYGKNNFTSSAFNLNIGFQVYVH